ncbi:hypothetical protein ASPWEDRAFT_66812 [Aspergillus wentii DTO 134E9]|uniref:Zn(2)-C6 fungal-type domain-containing protein n=1 Tax=Aspergillus wentii DTO 134E9 TaxID=1073089 RepID=A0A1L9RNI2_ASPWE|nr:uncharacterized protein ASPWEDRAFT_66812 [Aspergillus wentii DTO 134E9]OJJ36397.1 hypothetical protein ASPWEDRAFT_66812 [Aspergillus wentii DTO 134E9]
MRSTLACQWCRNAKIKCHHDGSPPCRSCRLNPGRDCVLSIPKYRSKRGQTSHRVRRDRLSRTSGSLEDDENQGMSIGQSSNGDIRRRDEIDDPLPGLDKKLLEHAFYLFVRLFPEFGFFHQPTFVKGLDDKSIPTLLLCGILSLSARFIPELVARYGSPAKACEHFATHARQNIMGHVTAAMDIHTGQTLLMLSLYDWGNGDGSRAWIYNGMATRIVHGVYAQTKESARSSPSSLNNSRVEEACRTVWACFLLDTMIGCGKCQASQFSMSTSGTPLPLGEDHFAFGDGESCQPVFLDMWDLENDDYQGLSTDKMGCDQSLTLIIRGFYIWQTISAWVSTGGRRREFPSSRKPPWHGSSFWSRSMAAVEDWRSSQSPQLIYSTSNVNLSVYISRGDGERFAVINLLYFLNLIFLHREYIPFIPHSTNRPQGPIDPPLLMEDAPPGWWDQSAQGLFTAVSNIIQIMQELDQRGVQFQTPFTSFCVFSAATTLAYANTWPHMAPGLDAQHASDLFSWASAWLNRACKIWKVSNGWYRTMFTLRKLYTQSKVNPAELVDVGGNMLPRLADNIQRLAGSETLEVGDIPTANILLLLQRQQEQKENRPTSPVEAEENDPLGEMMLLPSDFMPDQDLFASILSDPSGDRIRPFFDATLFAPQ